MSLCWLQHSKPLLYGVFGGKQTVADFEIVYVDKAGAPRERKGHRTAEDASHDINITLYFAKVAVRPPVLQIIAFITAASVCHSMC